MDNKDKTMTANRSGLRRLGFVAAGLGVGAALTYLLARTLGGRQQSFEHTFPRHVVDDRGTGQEKAAHILRTLRDRAFEASDEKLAIALGRPIDEIHAWNSGQDLIDDDVVMKARGIAMHRGIRVE